MTAFLAFTIAGIITGAAYSIAASGLVLTYATTRIFNIAHGAMGMVMTFVYWTSPTARGFRPGCPWLWCCSSSPPRWAGSCSAS